MMNPFDRDLLNFRPEIIFVGPPSEETIPEVKEIPKTKSDRVKELKTGFDNVVKLADAVEKTIDSKVGKFTAKLNLQNPEDMVTAQAMARMFPDCAVEIAPGLKVCTEISYHQFKHCVKDMEAYAKKQAEKSLIPAAKNVAPSRTDFGGTQNPDNRPDINNITAPIAPLDIAAFIAAGIPILFNMLFPLISGYVKTQIIGHTHPVIVPPATVPLPTLNGIPVIP